MRNKVPKKFRFFLTYRFVERGERGHAMHDGKVLCAQSRLVKDCNGILVPVRTTWNVST